MFISGVPKEGSLGGNRVHLPLPLSNRWKQGEIRRGSLLKKTHQLHRPSDDEAMLVFPIQKFIFNIFLLS